MPSHRNDAVPAPEATHRIPVWTGTATPRAVSALPDGLGVLKLTLPPTYEQASDRSRVALVVAMVTLILFAAFMVAAHVGAIPAG